MRVARITPAPRAPRPDDPTPRQPPARLFGGATLGDLGANKRIVARPVKVEDHVLRRAREVMLHLPRSEGSSGKEKDKEERNAVFKMPELPAKARRKQGEAGTDVFGAVALPRPQSADDEIGNTIEDANRRVRIDFDAFPFRNADPLSRCSKSCRCSICPMWGYLGHITNSRTCLASFTVERRLRS